MKYIKPFIPSIAVMAVMMVVGIVVNYMLYKSVTTADDLLNVGGGALAWTGISWIVSIGAGVFGGWSAKAKEGFEWSDVAIAALLYAVINIVFNTISAVAQFYMLPDYYTMSSSLSTVETTSIGIGTIITGAVCGSPFVVVAQLIYVLIGAGVAHMMGGKK